MTDTHTEALVERVADILARLPVRDMQGVSVGFHDLDIMRRREAAREIVAAIEALPARNDERALKLVEALPEDWSFWLDDAACILRSNGTVDHANAVRDTAIAIRAALADTQPSGETR